ncbi:TPA: hypothetical protein ACWLT0_003901 [Pseudomonas aeruginosa]|jgi:hypothetical protein
MKRVFIANFGRENYEWPNCLERSTVATMNSVETHGLWLAGDREGFISACMEHERSHRGTVPTKAVASRWFNLMTTIAETTGDIWIHREKGELWWTESLAEPATFELSSDPTGQTPKPVYVCHKPCKPWSKTSKKGHRLDWNSLHPKARDFLSTEATLQQLSTDYAAYALALVQGDDLSPWHDSTRWKEKASKRPASPVESFSDLQVSAYRMAKTAWDTTQNANGQEVLQRIKNKDFGFANEDALRLYIEDLHQMQEGLCALTGIPMQLDRNCDDEELKCSLDRIDSNGHYAPGNLQLVCRFANRWKSDSENADFMRLIDLVRDTSGL